MKKKSIFNSEKQISILRRYLHILALLQNNKDSQDWNGSTLADIIQYEEDKLAENSRVITGKNILDYKKILNEEFDLPIEAEKGSRRGIFILRLISTTDQIDLEIAMNTLKVER